MIKPEQLNISWSDWILGGDVDQLFQFISLNHWRVQIRQSWNAYLIFLLFVTAVSSNTVLLASTLSDVKMRGHVNCGISKNMPGFSTVSKNKVWSGLSVDFCRSVATAIFNDPKKVKYFPLAPYDSISALQGGSIDLLIDSTSWTLKKDAGYGLNFVGVLYFDGQAFMVSKSLGVSSTLELSGASICLNQSPILNHNSNRYFSTKKMPFKIISYSEPAKVIEAYETGRCNVLTGNISHLAAVRLKLKDPDNHLLLPEIISKEPRGPVVRQGDDQWFNLIKWVLFAIINAEELGITKANVSDMISSENIEISKLLGSKGKLGDLLGVDKNWVHNIIRSVGNFGEMYATNIGARSNLKIDRGLNNLWNNGGILYAPPIR